MNLSVAIAQGAVITILFFVVLYGFAFTSEWVISWMLKTFPSLPLIVPYLIVAGVLVFLMVTIILYMEGNGV